MDYLENLGFTADEVTIMKGTVDNSVQEQITMFPKIVTVNYELLKATGVKNNKDIFMKHAKVFLENPDKLKATFDKYVPEDLIRCLEKNDAVIEKL